MKNLHDRVTGDDDHVKNENQNRKQKQARFFEEIRNQMDQNVSQDSFKLSNACAF